MPDDPAPDELLGVAADHATERVPSATPDQSAAEVRGALAGKSFECADDVAVLEGRAVVGLVPIEALLAADPDARMADIMDASPPLVAPGVDQEQVAWHMVQRGESSVAVVDDDGRFTGLVPPHRMLAVLLAAHDRDLARLGGFMRGTSRARGAAEERISRRLWHRLPWLLVGVAGAMASVAIIGSFEDQLEEKVLISFFVPAVVYLADAVGTQTETVLIRGLSVGIAMRTVVRRELLTGMIIGVIIGATFVPFALVGWGDGAVAVAVGLALLASCSIATLVAMTLPWTFQRLGFDPAFGSGPLATVVQDLLSIAVYFAIAVPLAA